MTGRNRRPRAACPIRGGRRHRQSRRYAAQGGRNKAGPAGATNPEAGREIAALARLSREGRGLEGLGRVRALTDATAAVVRCDRDLLWVHERRRLGELQIEDRVS